MSEAFAPAPRPSVRGVLGWLATGVTIAVGCSAPESSKGGTTGSSNAGTAGSSVTTGGATSSSGGSSTTSGGSAGSGGAGVFGGNGGTSGGGGAAGGGAAGSGGTVTGTCGRTVGSCSSPEVRITEIDMGVEITAYGNEGDTQPLPLAIAALDGGSRVAVRGTDGNIFIGLLDCDDNLVGTPFAIPAVNLQDLYADANGGVVQLTRNATGPNADHCGGPDVAGGGDGALCGGTTVDCLNSFLVRFDNVGNETWATAVTNLDADQEGYVDGARFIWERYQHHGRIAFDGSNYAAYFCIGITTDNNACVDIHEGDRMQVVDGSGNLVDHDDAFEVGCSHSWTTRMVWDPRTSHFVMVCATDNPDPENCGIAQPPNWPDPYRKIATVPCNGHLFGGDVVLSTTDGYWTAWGYDGQTRLEHFTDGASDTTIMNAAASEHPHLVSYSEGKMLLAWESGSGMTAQIRDAGTADTIGSEFPIDVEDHDFMSFKAFPDGSAAYAAAGSTNTKVKIARVMPCSE